MEDFIKKIKQLLEEQNYDEIEKMIMYNPKNKILYLLFLQKVEPYVKDDLKFVNYSDYENDVQENNILSKLLGNSLTLKMEELEALNDYVSDILSPNFSITFSSFIPELDKVDQDNKNIIEAILRSRDTDEIDNEVVERLNRTISRIRNGLYVSDEDKDFVDKMTDNIDTAKNKKRERDYEISLESKVIEAKEKIIQLKDEINKCDERIMYLSTTSVRDLTDDYKPEYAGSEEAVQKDIERLKTKKSLLREQIEELTKNIEDYKKYYSSHINEPEMNKPKQPVSDVFQGDSENLRIKLEEINEKIEQQRREYEEKRRKVEEENKNQIEEKRKKFIYVLDCMLQEKDINDFIMGINPNFFTEDGIKEVISEATYEDICSASKMTQLQLEDNTLSEKKEEKD